MELNFDKEKKERKEFYKSVKSRISYIAGEVRSLSTPLWFIALFSLGTCVHTCNNNQNTKKIKNLLEKQIEMEYKSVTPDTINYPIETFDYDTSKIIGNYSSAPQKLGINFYF